MILFHNCSMINDESYNQLSVYAMFWIILIILEGKAKKKVRFVPYAFQVRRRVNRK